MYSLLLAVIYLSFISLGLPDPLLGAGWPVIRETLQVPSSAAGIITIIVSGGTVISSLLTDRLIRRLGAGLLTVISVGASAIAMWGFSLCDTMWQMCLWAIPYGLGAGAVDAALNNFVSLHYAARHMSWLHCFWGVGVTISPYIMGRCLTAGVGWQGGYRAVAILQVALTVILVLTLPLWNKVSSSKNGEAAEEPIPLPEQPLTLKEVVSIPGVWWAMLSFFAYCSLESSVISWTSTYMADGRGIAVDDAARYGAMFCLGITFGRFLSGLVADRFGDKNMVRIAITVMAAGLLLLLLPGLPVICFLIGLVLLGIGCGPIYPSLMHATPANFGRENSQAVIGVEMATAYIGSTFMPPVFGLLGQAFGMGLFPLFLLFFFLLLFLMTASLNTSMKKVGRA